VVTDAASSLATDHGDEKGGGEVRTAMDWAQARTMPAEGRLKW
jgi:hypothetical protein